MKDGFPRARTVVVFALTFFSFLLAPLYMGHLRYRFERSLPEEWSKVTNNGPFTYVSPLVVTTRNHEEGVYAIKVQQIARYGFPYDPHTGDRTLKSWLFDSMMFYPLAPFVWITGDLQYGYVLAHATLGALWLLFFYLLCLRVTQGDRRYSIFFAVGSLFFWDCLLWVWTAVIPCLWNPAKAGLMAFHLIARACGEVQFLRLPSPGMTFLWLYAGLAVVYLLAVSPRRRWLASAAIGGSLALLSLAHFYEWVFGVGSLVLFAAIAYQRNIPYAGRWNLGIAGGVCAALSLAYYWSADQMTRAVMPDIIERVGTPGMRSFAPESLLYLLVAVWAWLEAGRRKGDSGWMWFFYAAQAATAFLSCNLSLVLGYDMQFDHFRFLGAFTTGLMCLCRLIESRGLARRLRPHSTVLIAAVFAWVFMRENNWSSTHYRLFGTPRDVAEAADWLDRNAPPDSMLLTLSGALTEFLPQRLRMRFAVANGSPAYGSPIPTSHNLRGLAAVLKTMDADIDRFLAERWEHPAEKDDQKQTHAYLTRNLSWKKTEACAWPYFLLNTQAYRDWAKLEGPVREHHRSAQVLPRPFYFWLQSGDESLLRRSPEALGGVLIHENPSVRLYHFGG